MTVIMKLNIAVTYEEISARLEDARASSTIYGSLNDSILMTGRTDDTSGDYTCIVFAPNTEGPGWQFNRKKFA